MPETSASYRVLLFEELSQRRKKNPLYSLRAFARDLQVSTTCLSDVLAQKRRFSKKNAAKIAQNLGLAGTVPSSAAIRTPTDPRTSYDLQTLTEAEFAEISDWHHYAILNLAKLRSNNASPAWIARRLAIDEAVAATALERLTAAGLIQVCAGKLHRTSRPLTTSNGVPSSSIRKYHSQILQLASRSLEQDPVETREFAAATIAIDPARIDEAREMLYSALEKVTAFLELGDASHRREVYSLAVQFFPLTRALTSRSSTDA
jgi:hypothetical protein